MNQLVAAQTDLDEELQEDFHAAEANPRWEMKKLTQRHKQIASLLAQGEKNVVIADLMKVTPQYVSMLTRQPMMRAYIAEMCEAVGVRFESLFAQAVEVIADTMKNGSEAGKLKAARLQLEGTKRIGRPDPNPKGESDSVGRLERLAERLLYLQGGVRPPGVYSEAGEKITDAEFSVAGGGQVPQPAQELSDGQDG